MEFIPWQKYYEQHKDQMPLNEIVANYNLWIYQYESLEENTLWLQKGGTSFIEVNPYSGFILQENGDYLLQENGDRIYL